jgi:murein DD-endopeptidase MepM/ murein hydrolase activator NlpD
MKRLVLALALALACVTGTARADTFRIVPDVLAALPSADVPNLPGQIAVPPDFTRAPAQPQTRSGAELESLWQHAGSAYGIPWSVLAAINKVESNFGRNMGPSSAGAIGWMQFMPSTWLRWGVDANGDGIADPWNPDDAVYSAARYLAASGGASDVAGSVFSYNHAQWYVDEVMQLASAFDAGGVTATVGVDRLQQSVVAARQQVVAANRALVPAERRARALARRAARLAARANAPGLLLSDRLARHKIAVQAGYRQDAAAARVRDLQAELDQAAEALQQANEQSQSAALSPATGSLFGAPTAQGNYAFPVGGGPGVVSVGHTHHDYPAADIAAPEGSPVYALSDAAVLRAWRIPDARCGIGLTLRTADGLTWTYCHLAYLDPTVQARTILAAGAPVGLVGHTGDATGPHLHLQLDPATSYPQSQPWFESFAGTAFRWQDAPTPGSNAPATGSVFAVVPAGKAAAPADGVVRFTHGT